MGVSFDEGKPSSLLEDYLEGSRISSSPFWTNLLPLFTFFFEEFPSLLFERIFLVLPDTLEGLWSERGKKVLSETTLRKHGCFARGRET